MGVFVNSYGDVICALKDLISSCRVCYKTKVVRERGLHKQGVTRLAKMSIVFVDTNLFEVIFGGDKPSSSVFGDKNLGSWGFGEFVPHVFDCFAHLLLLFSLK